MKGLGKGRGGKVRAMGTQQESVTRWVHPHTPSSRAVPGQARQKHQAHAGYMPATTIPFSSKCGQVPRCTGNRTSPVRTLRSSISMFGFHGPTYHSHVTPVLAQHVRVRLRPAQGVRATAEHATEILRMAFAVSRPTTMYC